MSIRGWSGSGDGEPFPLEGVRNYKIEPDRSGVWFKVSADYLTDRCTRARMKQQIKVVQPEPGYTAQETAERAVVSYLRAFTEVALIIAVRTESPVPRSSA
jgi:hypothetical protein